MNSPKHSRAASRVEKYQRYRRYQNTGATGTTTTTTTTMDAGPSNNSNNNTAEKATWRTKKLTVPPREMIVLNDEEDNEHAETVLVEEETTSTEPDDEHATNPLPTTVMARRQAFDRAIISTTPEKSWKRPTTSSNGTKTTTSLSTGTTTTPEKTWRRGVTTESNSKSQSSGSNNSSAKKKITSQVVDSSQSHSSNNNSVKKFAAADRWSQAVTSPTSTTTTTPPLFWKTHQQVLLAKPTASPPPASSTTTTTTPPPANENYSPRNNNAMMMIAPKQQQQQNSNQNYHTSKNQPEEASSSSPPPPPPPTDTKQYAATTATTGRLRVSDVRSMFQQQAANRPVVASSSSGFKSSSKLPQSSSSSSSSYSPLSPIAKISSPPMTAAAADLRPTEETTLILESNEGNADEEIYDPNDDETSASSNSPKQWDSPRRARLRALAAAAETATAVTNHKTMTTNMKNQQQHTVTERPRIAEVFQRKIDQHTATNGKAKSVVSKPKVESIAPSAARTAARTVPARNATTIVEPPKIEEPARVVESNTVRPTTRDSTRSLARNAVEHPMRLDPNTTNGKATVLLSSKQRGVESNAARNGVKVLESRSFMAKINSAHRDDKWLASRNSEAAAIEPPIIPPQEDQSMEEKEQLEEEEQSHQAIETPQKLSVSAMKAKLWGDAEKLKVPTKKRTPIIRKDFEPPTSPVSDTRRLFDTAGGFPKSPILSSPPRNYHKGTYIVSSPPPPQQQPHLQQPQQIATSMDPDPQVSIYADPPLSPMPDSEEEEYDRNDDTYENYDQSETELNTTHERIITEANRPQSSTNDHQMNSPPTSPSMDYALLESPPTESSRMISPLFIEKTIIDSPPPVSSTKNLDVSSPPLPPTTNAWMNRTFKRNINSALESKIHSIWENISNRGGETRRNGRNDAADDDMNLPDLVEEREMPYAMPPRPSSRTSNGMSPPREPKGHVRSTSIGDFQIEVDPPRSSPPNHGNDNEPVEPRGHRLEKAEPDEDFRGMSPPSRPGFLKSRNRSDEPPSLIDPDQEARNSKRIVYEMAGETGFSEAIDQPPFEDTSDTDALSEHNFDMGNMSPRSNRGDYPWTKDAGSLSPSMWQRRKEPDFDDDLHPMTMPARNRVKDLDDHKESSLDQMAKDSFFALDHDQAMETMMQKTESDDYEDEERDSVDGNERSLPSDVPPEFERVVADDVPRGEKRPTSPMPGGSPVFGYPESFGAAGDETVPADPVSVAERAQAIAAWNGGLGVSPQLQIDKQELYRQEIYRREIAQGRAQNVLPSGSFEETGFGEESAFNAMSPNFDRKGVAIDDWNLDQQQRDNGEYMDQSTDVWVPAILDSFAEYDWVNSGEKPVSSNESGTGMARRKVDSTDDESRGLPAPRSEPSPDAFSSIGPIDADDVYFSMSAPVKQPTEEPEALEKPRTDNSKQKKNLQDWRKRQEQAGKRGRMSQTTASLAPSKAIDDFVFNPFDDPFESKVDNTESTEPTDGTDLFGSPDPFFGDANSFTPPKIMKPIPKRGRDIMPKGGSYPTDDFLFSSTSDKDGLSNLYTELAPPSGTFDEVGEVKTSSKDEVWSYDIGQGLSYDLDTGNPVVYDADSSNLNDSAVEVEI